MRRRGSSGGAGSDRPAGCQIAGGRRASRGRDPLPAAGYRPSLRGGPARRTGGTDAARHRHALAFPGLAKREREPPWRVSRTISVLRWSGPWPRATRPDRSLPALGGFWLARGLLQEGQDWLERALARCPPMRSCERICCGCSALSSVRLATWTGRSRAFRRFSTRGGNGSTCLQARIGVLRADVEDLQGASFAETLAKCEKAEGSPGSEGDVEGLAEALTSVGKVRYWLGDVAGSERPLNARSAARGKAATIARRCEPATGSR